MFSLDKGINGLRSTGSRLETAISEAPTQRIRNEKCASSEGWHEQWVKVPPEQESKAP